MINQYYHLNSINSTDILIPISKVELRKDYRNNAALTPLTPYHNTHESVDILGILVRFICHSDHTHYIMHNIHYFVWCTCTRLLDVGFLVYVNNWFYSCITFKTRTARGRLGVVSLYDVFHWCHPVIQLYILFDASMLGYSPALCLFCLCPIAHLWYLSQIIYHVNLYTILGGLWTSQ